MYKSFTSKAIFPWSGRWRRAVRQRWTGWKTAILLSILVQNVMLSSDYPSTLNPSRCLEGESILVSSFWVREKHPEVSEMAAQYRWARHQSKMSPHVFEKADFSPAEETERFVSSALHQCPLSRQALLLPKSATSLQYYIWSGKR